MKKSHKKIRQPTHKELQEMSLKEIADLIKKTRDRLWPPGPKRNLKEEKRKTVQEVKSE